MPWSTDVALPIDHAPRFPALCVVCGGEDPSSHVTCRDSYTNPLLGFFLGIWWLLFAKNRSKIEVPACLDCAGVWRRKRFFRGLTQYGVIALVAVYLFGPGRDLLPESRSLQKFVFLGFLLVALVPFILQDLFFPLPFELQVWKKRKDYCFRDREIAGRFAEANGTSIDRS